MIYLDNAATTFPKPPCVNAEIERCIREYCGNPGRSGHALSVKAAEKIYECRQAVASFFGSDKPENVVFTLNTTYALNVAIKSLYQKGSHVLISNMEHNSVYRPIEALSRRGEIRYSIFNVMQSDEEVLQELCSSLRLNTRMLIMQHASNVCGKVFPVNKIGAFCRAHHILFIVDAAQSAGIHEINMNTSGIDALCVPAHKGLYGTQGLGFVLFGDAAPIRTLIEGGNGIYSLSPEMGLDLPESFEAGTLPTPAIAGLCASLQWIKGIGIRNICTHEIHLAKKLSGLLAEIPGSLLYGPETPESGIVLFRHEKVPTDALSRILDTQNICARSGFHCSPLSHATLKTGESGAIRFSMGAFNTEKEVETVYKVIRDACN